ncbi:MAG: DUF167 domain-containing protein [Candidatus Omnitrophica bacterium]|nr:DUF167 domain-containing protein [Candidatus Omnitrophota bacterium]
MKLFVTAKPGAKENRVEKVDETHFRVWVKAPPDKGRANQAVIEVLSEYLDIPKSRFALLRGASSKSKVLEIS